ncbi:potassium efflux system protein [Bacillus ectoiniformans]|uniref:mechanosensitive ion channel family protein n=1 Tax=Bacillus ectoiniformans TaxID=1494429 RepID=UPI001EF7C5A5|nr:mechanosensitive ion channel domain-containing protein [Bacillus ectoiniformans]MBM7647802.1 potassium efflux system protein [Bacillus ectoiniformans]
MEQMVDGWYRTEILYFMVISSVIILTKWLVMFKVKKSQGTEEKKAVWVWLQSVLNWFSFYGIILLFLYYFSNESWLFYSLYSTDEVEVTLFLLLVLIVVISFAHRIARLFNRIVMPNIYEFYGMDRGSGATISQIIYYIVMTGALGFSFAAVGLDLATAAAVFSVLGIGIGFGLRNVAGNFISGIIILFERPIKVGDTVEINGKFGRVEKIRLRSTLVQTAKEGALIVPNQYFLEQVVPNRSGAEILAEVRIQVAYGEDTVKVERLLHEAAEKIIKEKDIQLMGKQDVRFVEFRHQAMIFLVEVPVQNIEIKQRTESYLRHAIAEIFYSNEVILSSEQSGSPQS